MISACYDDCLLWWLSAIYDDDCLLYDCLLWLRLSAIWLPLYNCLGYIIVCYDECLLWWWLSAIMILSAMMIVELWRVSDMMIVWYEDDCLLWWWVSAMMMILCYDDCLHVSLLVVFRLQALCCSHGRPLNSQGQLIRPMREEICDITLLWLVEDSVKGLTLYHTVFYSSNIYQSFALDSSDIRLLGVLYFILI